MMSSAPSCSKAMSWAPIASTYASRIPSPSVPARARFTMPVLWTSGTPDSSSTTLQAA